MLLTYQRKLSLVKIKIFHTIPMAWATVTNKRKRCKFSFDSDKKWTSNLKRRELLETETETAKLCSQIMAAVIIAEIGDTNFASLASGLQVRMSSH